MRRRVSDSPADPARSRELIAPGAAGLSRSPTAQNPAAAAADSNSSGGSSSADRCESDSRGKDMRRLPACLVGGPSATQVENEPGREAAFRARDPGDHGGDL